MRIKQKLINTLLIGTLLAPIASQTAFAGTGVIYISPASSSLQDGSSETLSLRINPGMTVDGVQATVSFNSSLLRLNSVDTSGSPFSAQLQKTVTGSGFTVALGNLSGGVSSDSLIATFNVTALVSSGSAALSIGNANATSGGSYTNPSAANGSIDFTSPPVAAPAPTPTPVLTSTSKSTTPKSTTTTTAPTTSAATSGTATPYVQPHLATSINPGYTSAILTVKSDQNLINIHAIYGDSTASLTSQTAVASQTMTASLKLGEQTPLLPGTTYYYRVIAQTTDGTQTKTGVQHFTTRGYTVSVTVLGKDNQPLAHQKVSLHSTVQTAETDGNGVATFTNVAPGEHHLEYIVNNQTYSAVVYVDNAPMARNATTPTLQNTAVIFPTITGTKHSVLATVSSIIVACAAIIGLVVVFVLNPHYAAWLRRFLVPRKHVLSHS